MLDWVINAPLQLALGLFGKGMFNLTLNARIDNAKYLNCGPSRKSNK